MGKIAVFVLPMEGVVDADAGRKERLGDVQHFAAVGTVAVFGEVRVEMVLETVVVALRWVFGGGCEGPALVLLARFVMLAGVFVQVVLGDLVELSPDVVGDVFDDFGVGGGGGEVFVEKSLVEGEDAFDFDAEGHLEGGVDHVDGALDM